MISFECPYCKTAMEIEDQYAASEVKCINCDQIVTVPSKADSAERCCSFCGSKCSEVVEGSKSWNTYMLLNIFLGMYGAGDFYIGRPGIGCAKLAITLISCGLLGLVTHIWGVIDLTKIRTDAEGNPLL